MKISKNKILAGFAAGVLGLTPLVSSADIVDPDRNPIQEKANIQIAILLDGSGSMNGLIDQTKKRFEEEMDNDLEISNALAVIFDFVKDVNTLIMKNDIGKKDAEKVYKLMLEFDGIFGVLETKEGKIPTEIKKLIKEREESRKNKDYTKADKIREEIKNKGFILEDTGEGTTVK